MLYENLYNLMSDTASELPFDVDFHQGEGYDINPFNLTKSVLIWVSPFRRSATFVSSGNRLLSNINIEVAFYQSSFKDATADESREILQQTDKVLHEYLIRLNSKIVDLVTASYDIELQGINVTPFTKITSHVLTGQLATLTIVLPDDFKYCCDVG